MLAFAYFLLKVTICSAVLFCYYWFFLRNKIFHSYNRFYLLAIVLLSLALPLCKINVFHKAEAPKTNIIKMLQAVTVGDEFMDEVIVSSEKTNLSFADLTPLLYPAVSAVFLIMLLQMLLYIRFLKRHNENRIINNIHFVNTDNGKGTPFSFFSYIFWNKNIDLNSPDGNRIFRHELAHIQERHSWDKMFINIILILFWCNPVFWFIRRELSMIHEFIADKRAVEGGDTAAFASMILAAAYPQHRFAVTNNFFYSPIKRRLMMLTKKQNARMNYFSRILVLPLIVIVFAAFAIKAKTLTAEKSNPLNTVAKIFNKITGNTIEKEKTGSLFSLTDSQITVVIDAGHGGDDTGAGNDKGLYEKNLALQLIKKIKGLNTNRNIKIILTREDDTYSTPQEKAAFAKAQNPDLFISVHINNAPRDMWNISTGLEVYVSTDENTNSLKSKVFASAVIGAFQNKYELPVTNSPSQRQKGIFILKANKFPSILIEAGYLNNKKDAAYLQSKKGQEMFAINVLNAINNFASSKDFNDVAPKKIIYSDTLGYFKGKAVISAAMQTGKKLVIIQFADGAKESITMQDAITAKLIPSAEARVSVGVANEDDIALFKKLGKPFIRVEQDSDVPATDGILIIRDGTITNSAKLYKGDLLEILKKKEAIEKYGQKASSGAIEITTKKISADPVFRIGDITGVRMAADVFKKQKKVTVTGDYEFIGATVYFSGNGFPKVGVTNLSGTDLTPLSTFIQESVPGTNITFDNISIKGKDGIMVIDGRSFQLF